MEKLRRQNGGLEEQLRLETKAKDDLMHEWIATQWRAYASTRETVLAERRSAKVREANREQMSSSPPSNIGSDPITPVSTRYVDVEIGRGKNRRRVDSGIGFLDGGDLVCDDDEHINRQIQNCLNSDIELPSSDGVDI